MNDKSLEDWRKQIDTLDEELLNVLAKRINIVRKIGEFKKARGISLLDEKRWQQILHSTLSKAKSLHLSQVFIEKLYNLIHEYTLEVEKNSKTTIDQK